MTDIRANMPIGLDPAVCTQIKENIKTMLRAATWLAVPDPMDPAPLMLFDTVKDGNLEDIKPFETPCCAIEEGNTDIFPDTNMVIQKRWRLFFNVKVIYEVGVDASDVVNYYFGRIVQVLVSNPHIANLTLCVDEAGNSIQINGASDPEPGGTLFLDIDYRHGHADPFTSI